MLRLHCHQQARRSALQELPTAEAPGQRLGSWQLRLSSPCAHPPLHNLKDLKSCSSFLKTQLFLPFKTQHQGFGDETPVKVPEHLLPYPTSQSHFLRALGFAAFEGSGVNAHAGPGSAPASLVNLCTVHLTPRLLFTAPQTALAVLDPLQVKPTHAQHELGKASHVNSDLLHLAPICVAHFAGRCAGRRSPLKSD